MNQKDFTSYVMLNLLTKFPFFKEEVDLSDDGVGYIEYPSKNGKLKLLISTRDIEITIGFAVGKGVFDWHIHMNMLGGNTEEQMVTTAIELIKQILNDKTMICFSGDGQYFIPDDEESMEDDRLDRETITKTFWSLL